MNTETLVAFGLPALIAAVGYTIKKVGDAMALREAARLKRADAVVIQANADKTDADTTGRIVVGREADAETIRDIVRELRMRIDRCETRHEVQEKRHEKDRNEWRSAMAAKDAQINALWGEVNKLNDAIEGMRP
jgi:hypothetical protein